MKALNHTLCFLLLLSFTSLDASAQLAVAAKTREHKLVIRNGFEETDEKAEPAEASFTIPEKGQNSFLINGGLSYKCSSKWTNTNHQIIRNTWAPFAVIQRNNMIDKEQYLYRAGGAFQRRWGPDNDDKLWNNYVNVSASYLHDRMDTSHSALVTGYYSVFKGGADNKFRLNDVKNFGKSRMAYLIGPSAGLEAQNKFASKTDSLGFQGRFYFDIDASIIYRAPAKGKKKTPNETWPKYVELSVSYTARYNIINTVAGSDDFIPLFTPKLSFYPTHSEDLSLALSYNSGADPIAGLKDQQFWKLALAFQLD